MDSILLSWQKIQTTTEAETSYFSLTQETTYQRSWEQRTQMHHTYVITHKASQTEGAVMQLHTGVNRKMINFAQPAWGSMQGIERAIEAGV